MVMMFHYFKKNWTIFPVILKLNPHIFMELEPIAVVMFLIYKERDMMFLRFESGEYDQILSTLFSMAQNMHFLSSIRV